MTGARFRDRIPALVGAILLAGCASTSPGNGDPAGRPSEREIPDRTDDPRFVAAIEAADPEFATQADALASGVYERFVHPDSVKSDGPGRLADAAHARSGGPGDPSTEELIGTLPGEPAYNPADAPGERSTRSTPGEARWTLQVGAFETETGALVRIRQLERDFADLPRWTVAGGGLYRVYLGRFADRERATGWRAAVAARGYPDAWVTEIP